MLCPKIHRQRVSIEFHTNKNLYDADYVVSLFDNFLHDLCGTLRMESILDPVTKHVEDGSSSYMMWKESGVQVHSWFAHKFVTVDIYSCKPFLVSDALDVIEYWFDPIILEVEIY